MPGHWHELFGKTTIRNDYFHWAKAESRRDLALGEVPSLVEIQDMEQ